MQQIIEQLDARSAAMMEQKPGDIEQMRGRMGARGQNASINIYAYMDIGTTVSMLYYMELDIVKEAYDLRTMIETTSHWLAYLADRIPRYYRFHDTSALLLGTVEALKACQDRQEARRILHAVQHYLSLLKFWIDLEIPWPELGVAFAKAKSDPEPVAP